MSDFNSVVLGLASGGGAVMFARHVFMVKGTSGEGYIALGSEPPRNTWVISMVMTLIGLSLLCTAVGISLKEAHDDDKYLNGDEIQEWTVYTIPAFGGTGLFLSYMALDAAALDRSHHPLQKIMWLVFGSTSYAILVAAGAVDQSANYIGITVAAAACLSLGFMICYATIVFGEEQDYKNRKATFWVFHIMSKTLLFAGFGLTALALGRETVSTQAADA